MSNLKTKRKRHKGIGRNLEPIGRTLVRVQIINHLLKLIRSSGMGYGARLPSEPSLAKSMKVSRPSLREAISVLETLGVLEVRRGIGAFIKNPNAAVPTGREPHRSNGTPPRAEIEELAPLIHTLRVDVESKIAELAAQRATSSDLERIEFELSRFVSAARNRDILEAAAADVAFHSAIANASGSVLLANILRTLEVPLHVEREETVGAYWNDVGAIAAHEQIFRAVKRRSPKQARAAMLNHLEHVGALIFQSPKIRKNRQER